MKGYDLLDLATRNLRESKLRNALTTMGIAVGVASLVAMLSLGIGLQQLANSRLSRSGLFDTIFVSSPQDMRGGEDRNENDKDKEKVPDRVLDEAAKADIAKVANVTEVAPEIRVMAEVRFGEKNFPAFLGALPPSAKNSDAFEDMQGSYFSSNTSDEVILQKEFAAVCRAPHEGRQTQSGIGLALKADDGWQIPASSRRWQAVRVLDDV